MYAATVTRSYRWKSHGVKSGDLGGHLVLRVLYKPLHLGRHFYLAVIGAPLVSVANWSTMSFLAVFKQFWFRIYNILENTVILLSSKFVIMSRPWLRQGFIISDFFLCWRVTRPDGWRLCALLVTVSSKILVTVYETIRQNPKHLNITWIVWEV